MRDAHAMKGFFMVNLVVSSGTEFASVSVESGVVLYVDGTEADAPFFWAMGERFALRAERTGSCPNCGFPVWSVTFSERSFNGPGAEFVTVQAGAGEVADESSAPLLALAFIGKLLDTDADLMALAGLLGVDMPELAVTAWLREVGEALAVLTEDAFARFVAEQVSQPGPDAYSEMF